MASRRAASRKCAGQPDFVYARHRYRLPGGPPRVVARVARPHMEEISLGVRGRGGAGSMLISYDRPSLVDKPASCASPVSGSYTPHGSPSSVNSACSTPTASPSASYRKVPTPSIVSSGSASSSSSPPRARRSSQCRRARRSGPSIAASGPSFALVPAGQIVQEALRRAEHGVEAVGDAAALDVVGARLGQLARYAPSTPGS